MEVESIEISAPVVLSGIEADSTARGAISKVLLVAVDGWSS